jgi:hypothetical protein
MLGATAPAARSAVAAAVMSPAAATGEEPGKEGVELGHSILRHVDGHLLVLR